MALGTKTDVLTVRPSKGKTAVIKWLFTHSHIKSSCRVCLVQRDKRGPLNYTNLVLTGVCGRLIIQRTADKRDPPSHDGWTVLHKVSPLIHILPDGKAWTAKFPYSEWNRERFRLRCLADWRWIKHLCTELLIRVKHFDAFLHRDVSGNARRKRGCTWLSRLNFWPAGGNNTPHSDRDAKNTWRGGRKRRSWTSACVVNKYWKDMIGTECAYRIGLNHLSCMESKVFPNETYRIRIFRLTCWHEAFLFWSGFYSDYLYPCKHNAKRRSPMTIIVSLRSSCIEQFFSYVQRRSG